MIKSELFMDWALMTLSWILTVYAIGRQGIAKRHLTDESKDLTPLLDIILEKVPPAPSDTTKPLRMQPFNLGYDNFVGRLAIGRVYEGVIHVGDKVVVKKPSGETRTAAITKLFSFKGTVRQEATEATAGDIVMVAGIADIDIGETICLSAEQETLPAIEVDEPTISLNFLVNSSPFVGKDGKFVTNRQLKERLEKELEVNVGLKIDFSSSDYYTVLAAASYRDSPREYALRRARASGESAARYYQGSWWRQA